MVVILVALLIGLLVGLVLCYFAARGGFEERVRQQFSIMRQGSMSEIKATVRGNRPDLKREINEELAPLMRPLPYAAGDIRFVGSPVPFIAFDGYSERDVQQLVFLFVDQEDDPIAQFVEECVSSGRLEWETRSVLSSPPRMPALVQQPLSEEEAVAVRVWARRQGYQVGTRGPISMEIRHAYDARSGSSRPRRR